jgi:hypothetical protein
VGKEYVGMIVADVGILSEAGDYTKFGLDYYLRPVATPFVDHVDDRAAGGVYKCVVRALWS